MKTIKFFAIAALFLGFSVNAMAQNTANASATAGARIITHLSIVNTQSLEFGNIVASSAGGTVTVATGDTTVAYSGVAAPAGLEGTIRPAEFTVTGDGSSKYSVQIEQKTALTSESGSPMSLTNFTHNSNKVLKDGTETFKVGATLNVGAKQAAGTYKGTFEVTVAYE